MQAQVHKTTTRMAVTATNTISKQTCMNTVNRPLSERQMTITKPIKAVIVRLISINMATKNHKMAIIKANSNSNTNRTSSSGPNTTTDSRKICTIMITPT